ncbi:MAG: alpha-L-fucosidase [Bacteroidales bacterium]|nr:alpha-L-fucosidase [Lentimicrobiaceae bacterium]MDD5694882.1 alpha-L-fucosidase [Bacteroidales bacterium]
MRNLFFFITLILFNTVETAADLSLPDTLQIISYDATSAVLLQNYAFIEPLDSPEAIIRKAATVVPTHQQLAWQQNEFIAFAHFGINTFTDREWGDGTEDPSLFNPVDFNARQWVKVIREAGMTMLIITAKHHDGFCLWPSQYTEHSVKNSPWKDGKGDLVAEVASACQEAGLKLGIYLSPWDRHELSYGDSPRYNAYFRNQLRELLTHYGKISEVWFDGACGEGPNGKRQEYDWLSYYRVIRELQPDAVIFGMGPDVRWVGTESGMGRETEWSVLPDIIRPVDSLPAIGAFATDSMFIPGDRMDDDLGSRKKLISARTLYWYPSEADVSIRPGWFYHAHQDSLVKTPQQLVDLYFSSVGRNSVLLLNIPPDQRGLISDPDIQSLMGMRRILDQIFDTNVLYKATIIASDEMENRETHFLVDGNYNTCWSADTGQNSATIEFTLLEPQCFDILMLQENIRSGQRIEQFHLEAMQDGSWKKICEGTTVGYKRLLRFAPMTADRIRLVISASRLNPELTEVGIYSSR